VPCTGTPTISLATVKCVLRLSRLRDGKYAYFRFWFLVFCARSNSRRTLPLQGILVHAGLTTCLLPNLLTTRSVTSVTKAEYHEYELSDLDSGRGISKKTERLHRSSSFESHQGKYCLHYLGCRRHSWCCSRQSKPPVMVRIKLRHSIEDIQLNSNATQQYRFPQLVRKYEY